MVLLAIILIGAGLACLGFVGYSLLKGGAFRPGAVPSASAGDPSVGGFPVPPPAASVPTSTAPAGPRPAGQRATAQNLEHQFAGAPPAPESTARPPSDYGSSPASAAPASRPTEQSPESAAAGPAIGLDLRERQELNFLRDRLTGLQRIDPDSLNESLRVMEKTERESPEAAPQLIVTGVLFLDHGRKIPGQIGRRGEIPTRIFSELRRVGNGTLILEGSSFLIHCGNTSYSYSAGDMDQILFQGSGLALVPIHPDRPIPLFLTGDVSAVKAYIKQNARIRSL